MSSFLIEISPITCRMICEGFSISITNTLYAYGIGTVHSRCIAVSLLLITHERHPLGWRAPKTATSATPVSEVT